MTMEGSVARFQSASEQAFLAARRDCESGVPAKEVRDQLRSSLDVARNATRDDRAASLTVGARVKALAEAQRTAFQKALEEFKTSVDRARAELKAAFDAPIEMGAPEQPKARSLEKE
ncbi:MAG: hypothetical protein IPL87_00070 [Candidatus Moraniibacteriota bacterium]|nr:MAG: hypothetical protein IPL87_00070 [Candidatus Moranbacteria bacterium]